MPDSQTTFTEAVATIRKAIDKANMMLVGYGANNTNFLLDARHALAVIEAEREEMVDALKFYANPEIYKAHPQGLAFDDRDRSFIAKSVLKKMGEA